MKAVFPTVEVGSLQVIGLLLVSFGFVVSLFYVGWAALESERRVWLSEAIPQRVAEAHRRFEEAIDLRSRAELQKGNITELIEQAQALRNASQEKLTEARMLANRLHKGGTSEIGNIGSPRSAAEDLAGIRVSDLVDRFSDSANFRWRAAVRGKPLSMWGVDTALDHALNAINDDLLREAGVLRGEVLSSVRDAHNMQTLLACLFAGALLALVAIPAREAAQARAEARRRQKKADERLQVRPLTPEERTERSLLAQKIRDSGNDWITVARQRKEPKAALWGRMHRLGLVRTHE